VLGLGLGLRFRDKWLGSVWWLGLTLGLGLGLRFRDKLGLG